MYISIEMSIRCCVYLFVLNNVLFSANVQALFRMLKVISSLGGEYRLLIGRKGFGLIVTIQWTMEFIFQSPNIFIRILLQFNDILYTNWSN
jgi:hypothetical protein